jgi:hypothetical protein
MSNTCGDRRGLRPGRSSDTPRQCFTGEDLVSIRIGKEGKRKRPVSLPALDFPGGEGGGRGP